MKKFREVFEVTGRGAFPLDMLRYDEAFPTDVGDGLILNERRTVRLATDRISGPTVGRWESFGWTVTLVDRFTVGAY